jgi:hypothetical protein
LLPLDLQSNKQIPASLRNSGPTASFCYSQISETRAAFYYYELHRADSRYIFQNHYTLHIVSACSKTFRFFIRKLSINIKDCNMEDTKDQLILTFITNILQSSTVTHNIQYIISVNLNTCVSTVRATSLTLNRTMTALVMDTKYNFLFF